MASIKPHVMKYFTDRPGQTVYLKDIQAELKIQRPASIQQVISRLTDEGWPIETKARGNAWMYMPGRKTQNGRRVFEELATTKNGDLLIQDELGNVYRAVEL